MVYLPGVRIELQGLADELCCLFLATFAFKVIRLDAVRDRKIRIDFQGLLGGRKRIVVLRMPKSEPKRSERQQSL